MYKMVASITKFGPWFLSGLSYPYFFGLCNNCNWVGARVMELQTDSQESVVRDRYCFDVVPLWVLAAICTTFLVIKAVTTGLWHDEALFLVGTKAIISGDHWKTVMQAQPQSKLGVLIPQNILHSLGPYGYKLFSFYVSIGPVLVLPGLLVSWLAGEVHPPLLHLLVLAQVGIAGWFLRDKAAFALLLICITATPAVFPTQYLGEVSAVIWIFAGLVLLCEGRFFAAGVCLAFGPLAKLLGWLPLLGVLFGVFLTRPWRQSCSVAFGVVLPLVLWEVYQVFSSGGLVEYAAIKLDFVAFVAPYGDSVGGATKPFPNVIQDFLRWFRGGGVGAWAAALLTAGGMPRVAYRVIRRKEAGFFELAWLAYAPGWLWWGLFAQWINHSALLRHGGIFAGLGLLALLHETRGFEKRQLPRSGYYLARLILYGASVVAIIVLGWQSHDYIWEYKGYGPYTSWIEQRELARWTDTYGPLQLLNCDSYLNYSRLMGDIVWPQIVLSSGKYTVVSCVADNSARAMVVLGSAVTLEMPEGFVPTERAGPFQTLWVRK